ncbi:hypothetical protein RI367_007594 [Sorochytrium milnesiophthora]
MAARSNAKQQSPYETVYAVHDFDAEDTDEISFKAGDVITVLEKDDEFGDGWWMGRTTEGNIGLFPANFTSSHPPSPGPTSPKSPKSPTAAANGDGSPSLTRNAPTAKGANKRIEPLTRPHPSHRESIYSLKGLDEYDRMIIDLRKSISISTQQQQALSGAGSVGSLSPPHSPRAAALARQRSPLSPTLPNGRGQRSPRNFDADADADTDHDDDASEVNNKPGASGSLWRGKSSADLEPETREALSAADPASRRRPSTRAESEAASSYRGSPSPEHSHRAGSSVGSRSPSQQPTRSGTGGSSPRGRHPRHWPVTKVADWIASIGFPQYADRFIDNEIAGEELLSLTLATLKELDILALGKRMQIMNSITALKEDFGIPVLASSLLSPTGHPTASMYSDVSSSSVSQRKSTQSNGSERYSHQSSGSAGHYDHDRDWAARQQRPPMPPAPDASAFRDIIDGHGRARSPTSAVSEPQTFGYNGGGGSSNSALSPYPPHPSSAPLAPVHLVPGAGAAYRRPSADVGMRGPPSALSSNSSSVGVGGGESVTSPKFEKVNISLSTDLQANEITDPDCEGFFKTLADLSGHGAIPDTGSSSKVSKIITGHGTSSDWKKRYVMMKGNHMFIFRDKQSKALAFVTFANGFKIQQHESPRAGRHCFKLVELPAPAPVDDDPPLLQRRAKQQQQQQQQQQLKNLRTFYFLTDNVDDYKLWFRKLTMNKIAHTGHEQSKRRGEAEGISGVEIIGDPRSVIASIRMEGYENTELGRIAREWSDQGKPLPDVALLSKFEIVGERRPSLPAIQHHSYGGPSGGYPTPPMPAPDRRVDPGYPPVPRSKSTDPYDSMERDRQRTPSYDRQHPPAREPPYSPTRKSNPLPPRPTDHPRDGDRFFASPRDHDEQQHKQRVERYVTFINAYLAPNERITAFQDLQTGLPFVHFLSNVTRTPLPPHLTKLLRDPPAYRIDWMDNWDVALSWCRELGVKSLSPIISVDDLMVGKEASIMEIVEQVQKTFKPGRTL